MTNEESLDWLYRLRSEIYVYMPHEWLIPMNNALDEAIKKLEQSNSDLKYYPPCEDCHTKMDEIRRAYDRMQSDSDDDCISRKAVIKALCDDCELCEDGVQTCFSKCEEYLFLATLPSIQPKAKADVLDKIRAEIEEEYRIESEHPYGQGLRRAIEILDKYKAESEDKKCR